MTQLTVALVGNPNTGKSSLFNALCGLRARVGNFPGVTVERKIGNFFCGEQKITVVDLPGTYSLAARSLDEIVSVEVLLGECDQTPPIDVVLVVMDANHLERDLYLFSQVAELGKPMVVALNMWDCLEESEVKVDVPLLASRIGTPVIPTSANQLKGINEVRLTLANLAVLPPKAIDSELFPVVFRDEAHRLTHWIHGQGHMVRPYVAERLLLDIGGALEQRWSAKPRLNGMTKKLAEARARLDDSRCPIPSIEPQVRHQWSQRILSDVVHRPTSVPPTFSDRLDKVLTHPWWGLMIFVVSMFLIFQILFTDFGPFALLASFDERFPSSLNGSLESLLEVAAGAIEGIFPEGALRSLINDGIIAGVGGVLTFIPQIATLFVLLAIMEDCGYMARVAMIMDRWMSRLGLNGKAFLPLVTSFGCAVPGIMATRTIEHPRDRLITILIAPLMSCSARLPVYTLLITAFIPTTKFLSGWVTLQGLCFFAMYALGVIVAIPIAWLLKTWFFKKSLTPFVIELPRYSFPSWRVVLHRVWEQIKSFVMRAGTLILGTSIVLWALAYYPGDHAREHIFKEDLAKLQSERDQLASDPEKRSDASVATLDRQIEDAERRMNIERGRLIETSFLGIFGRAIEPIFAAVGWDWKIGVGVIASFPAREVIIATLGTIYSLGGEVDETSDSLQEKLKAATWPDGRPVFTVVTALSLMVFFALCAQCVATLVTIRQETRTWLWPIVTFVYMTALAYFGAWVVFVIGSSFS